MELIEYDASQIARYSHVEVEETAGVFILLLLQKCSKLSYVLSLTSLDISHIMFVISSLSCPDVFITHFQISCLRLNHMIVEN